MRQPRLHAMFRAARSLKTALWLALASCGLVALHAGGQNALSRPVASEASLRGPALRGELAASVTVANLRLPAPAPLQRARGSGALALAASVRAGLPLACARSCALDRELRGVREHRPRASARSARHRPRSDCGESA